MRLRTPLVALSLAAAVAACSTFESRMAPSRASCTGGMCTITVTVSGTGADRELSVVPDLLEMQGRQPAEIRWEIGTHDANDYRFDRNGVEFYEPKISGPQFSNPGPIQGGRAYQVHNANTDHNKHRYMVRVYDRDGSFVIKDPIIANDN